MRLYFQRHAQCEPGEAADMARPLTAQGKQDAEDMAMLMQNYIGRVDMVICSPAESATQTAEIMAAALGCSLIATSTGLLPDTTIEAAEAEIERLIQAAEDVLVISHEPLLSAWVGVQMRTSSVCATVSDGLIQWLVTRDMAAAAHESRAIERAAREVCGALELTERGSRGNKQGTYTYEEILLKRWVLGDGGRSGNCEICVDNSDRGWIDSEDVFDGVFGDVDEPEAHPNCTCTVEVKESRRRVYD